METKKRYEVNIRIFLVVGVFFLIWGLVLLSDALTIRKNLKNIYDENTELSKLEEGNYVTVNNVKVLGFKQKYSNKYTSCMYINMKFHKADNYVAINYNGKKDEYVSLLIETQVNRGGNHIEADDNGYVLLEENEEIFNSSFDFKVVKMNSEHLYAIDSNKKHLEWGNERSDIPIEDHNEIGFYDGIALKVIDYDKEREVLVWALSILFCAVVLIIASKPWSIIEEKYEPIREFNIVYNDKPDENDVAVAAELARTLRLDVLRYEDDYRQLKKNIRNNVIAVVLSGLVAFGIRYLGELYLLTIILIIKLIGSILIFIFNNDTYFTRNVMKVIGREPLKSILKERDKKIAKCDKVISDGLYNNREDLNY